MKKRLSELKQHPKNKLIYGVEEDLSDLVESVKELGVLEPIMINKKNVIISGNSRWRAAKIAGLKTIDVTIKEIPPEQEIYLLIHSNKQRHKTYVQILGEIKSLYDYYGRNQGKRNDLSTSVSKNRSSKGTVRDKIAKDVGVSATTIAHLMYIDKHRADLIQYIGKNITLAACYGQVKLSVNQSKITASYSPNGNGQPAKVAGKSDEDMFEIYNKSSKDMSEVPSESVDCIVTSPPYLSQRQYTRANKDEIGNEKSLDEYLDNLLEVFSQCKRVLKPTGSLFLIIGDSYKNQSAQLIPDRLAIRIIDELGLYLRNDLIWWKKGYAPESVTNRWTLSKEHIFFFTKSNSKYFFNGDNIRIPYTTEGIDRKPPRHYNNGQEQNITPSLRHPIGKMPPDVIHTARFTNPVEVDELGHSAPFPTRLIEPFISATTEPGFVVLDPFSGSASTGIVALENGCYYVGYEISKQFANMGRKRLKVNEGIRV